MRLMMKAFLRNLFLEWRAAEGRASEADLRKRHDRDLTRPDYRYVTEKNGTDVDRGKRCAVWIDLITRGNPKTDFALCAKIAFIRAFIVDAGDPAAVAAEMVERGLDVMRLDPDIGHTGGDGSLDVVNAPRFHAAGETAIDLYPPAAPR
jgi:hypothetical protein